MVNKVILIGNLGADPEVKETPGGAKVARLNIATNENYRDKSGEWQTQTEWHNVIAWRTLADKAESSLVKGDAVYLEGKLTHRSYEDKDGNKRYVTEVVANYFRRITKRDDVQSRIAQERDEVVNQAKNKPAPEQGADDLPF